MCIRDRCYAVQGRNQYHSIMGGMKTGKNSCSSQCPAGTDIPGYMQKIREDNWAVSYTHLKRRWVTVSRTVKYASSAWAPLLTM